MAALVCDLCGGKLIMGAGGIAICDSCGMEHSADRMKEKVQEIKGTVRVDNSHMVENYLEMANNAYDADNNAEAESYCNKIIEIDPTNYKAWFLKGKAAGWQSTLQNSRLSESVSAFAKAIVNAPEEEKEEIIEEAKDQVKNLSSAMINLRGNHFAKWPDEDETAGFTSDIASIFSIVLQFIKQAGVIIPIAELTAPIATTINQSVVKAFNDVIWPDYNGDPNDSDDRANKYEWQKFIKRIGHCTTLVEKAINLCDEDDESDIQRYENLIYLHEKAIDSCSWDYTFSSYSSSKIWSKEWSLTDEAKAVRRKLIAGYRAKIAEIKSAAERKAEEERKQRIKSYWDNHKQEKDALENEAKSLESQKKQCIDEIAQLQKQKESVPALAQLIQVQKNIEKLEEEKKALGLFKGKEKKAIQEKIDVQEADKNRLKQQVASQQQEIEQKITPVRTKLNAAIARLKAIDQELTKDRK
jgi:hypothetical protein